MLIDSGSDVTILKLASLHDDVWIRDSREDKLILNGIGTTITTIGQADCHIKIGNQEIIHPVHIVPKSFQLDEDGLLGYDILKRLGVKTDYNTMQMEDNQMINMSNVKVSQSECLIDTAQLNEEERNSIKALYDEFKDVFRYPDQYLTRTDTIKHEIPTDPSQPPINQKPYRIPEAQKQIIQEHIDDMLSNSGEC
ncbi:hypothetical protein J6590_054326 [Homalodisca vitripennis]|nr:hypothetical protein J6590_054326 [Homalodisca vitripennis]